LERALIAAQEGGFDEVEPSLRKSVEDGHPDAGVILEVLTPQYFGRFRLGDAKRCAAKWVELRPGSAKAWTYQGEILERLRSTDRAVASYREALRLDPDYRPARLSLIAALQNARQPPEEADALLEPLVRQSPDDPAVLRLVIRCREAQGRHDEAIAAADELLKRDPGSREGLTARGRLELDRGRPAAAASFLRQAVARAPYDPDALYTLLRCLNDIGPPEEAKAVSDRLERVKADLKKIQEIARQIVGDPSDPDLRREAGEICLRNGLDRDGLGWLATALEFAPDHAATHATLADYYARTGRPDLADYHRARASPR
jgi:tetratricopeptide (TPR) repeat protein